MGNLYFLSMHTCLKAHVYTKKRQVTRGKFHGIHLGAFHNHFISCHRKYSSQHSPIPNARDGKVGDNTE